MRALAYSALCTLPLSPPALASRAHSAAKRAAVAASASDATLVWGRRSAAGSPPTWDSVEGGVREQVAVL